MQWQAGALAVVTSYYFIIVNSESVIQETYKTVEGFRLYQGIFELSDSNNIVTDLPVCLYFKFT